jgi:pyruvate dehydrogenase E1 component alpha subunit
LNLAALFQLPVVYIIENNGYSMGTSQKRSSAFKNSLAERAEVYGMAWDVFGGEDIYEIRARTQVALERARRDCLPSLLEIQTYRYYGHSVADANAKKYRTPEEIEEYKSKHDPLRIWGKRLMDEGILDEAQAEEMDQKAKEEANAAVKFAEESSFPELNDIFTDIYWEVDNHTDAAQHGTYFFNH